MHKIFYITLILALLVYGCKTKKENKENIETENIEQEYFFPEEVPYYQNIKIEQI